MLCLKGDTIMKTELKHVVENLKNYTSWDYAAYPLQKAEADEIVKAFDNLNDAKSTGGTAYESKEE